LRTARRRFDTEERQQGAEDPGRRRGDRGFDQAGLEVLNLNAE
jgi:hypothetical protein